MSLLEPRLILTASGRGVWDWSLWGDGTGSLVSVEALGLMREISGEGGSCRGWTIHAQT